MFKTILIKDVCLIYLELIFKMVDLTDQILQGKLKMMQTL